MDVVYDIIEAIYFFIPIIAVCIVFGIVYFFKDSETLGRVEGYDNDDKELIQEGKEKEKKNN